MRLSEMSDGGQEEAASGDSKIKERRSQLESKAKTFLPSFVLYSSYFGGKKRKQKKKGGTRHRGEISSPIEQALEGRPIG